MDVFSSFADFSTNQYYRKKMQAEAILEVERLRSIAHKYNQNGGFGIDAKY